MLAAIQPKPGESFVPFLRPILERSLLILVGVALAGLVALVAIPWLDRASPADSEAFFVPEGDSFISHHPRMPGGQRFLADKPADHFRVFVLGGSQAMGDPYVHDMSALDGVNVKQVKIPEAGGIATWLRFYLQALYPDRTVEVINAATSTRGIHTVARGFEEICRIGAPDLVVIDSGNNEAVESLTGFPADPPFRSREEFATAVEQLGAGFSEQLDRIVTLVEQYRVPTYLLTVPTNLRDWIPWPNNAEALRTHAGIELPFGEIGRMAPPELEILLGKLEAAGMGEEALYRFLEAKRLDRSGLYAEARRNYLLAKDLDYLIIRARSDWNDRIRAVRSPLAVPVDTEKAMMVAAEDGIPGFDLFHDFCHMKVHAYMLMALHVARFHQLREGMPVVEFPQLEVSDYLQDLLAALYEIKRVKWERLRHEEVERKLGDENLANVAEEFARDRNDVGRLQRVIQALESELRGSKPSPQPAP